MRRTILLSILTFYSLAVCAQSLDYERIAAHPRLLLTEGEEEAIRKSIADYSSLWKVHEHILQESNEMLTQKTVERIMEGDYWECLVWH